MLENKTTSIGTSVAKKIKRERGLSIRKIATMNDALLMKKDGHGEWIQRSYDLLLCVENMVDDGEWNTEKLAFFLNKDTLNKVLMDIGRDRRRGIDSLKWEPTSHGLYTTKSAYWDITKELRRESWV